MMGIYHDRGDPAAPDFTFNTDTPRDTYEPVDLSAIVPEAGANHLVHLSVLMAKGLVAPLRTNFRKYGNVNTFNTVACSPVGDVGADHYEDMWVMMDTDRKIDCIREGLESAGYTVYITVRGWVTD